MVAVAAAAMTERLSNLYRMPDALSKTSSNCGCGGPVPPTQQCILTHGLLHTFPFRPEKVDRCENAPICSFFCSSSHICVCVAFLAS